jgi:uncharacterized membrane protein YkvA (DUF1232 family)
MTELETRCLDAFPNWLRTLGDEARALSALVEQPDLDPRLRRAAVGALNYLFRSLDLIPDGIEDLGFIDDAFVVRAAMAGVGEADLRSADASGTANRLTEEAKLVAEFLEADYERLKTFVAGLDKTSARGRSVDDILGDGAVMAGFVREVRAWADSYAPPTFSRDEKNLVKLKSFLRTKLPS